MVYSGLSPASAVGKAYIPHHFYHFVTHSPGFRFQSTSSDAYEDVVPAPSPARFTRAIKPSQYESENVSSCCNIHYTVSSYGNGFLQPSSAIADVGLIFTSRLSYVQLILFEDF